MSLESRVTGTILRPLMPPAALHQEVNTLAAFTNSGFLVNPTSLNTPTLISLSVTPSSVTDWGLPEWQTFLRVPKSAFAAAPDAAVDGPPAPAAGVERSEHPARARTSAVAMSRRLIGPPDGVVCWNCGDRPCAVIR